MIGEKEWGETLSVRVTCTRTVVRYRTVRSVRESFVFDNAVVMTGIFVH
ncbi:hypothetical protein V1478_006382 [Vespula squamosa]|uniref:Uncharacterized protein n=1 Tax=Vespula squamosa TaxID=30214 RepID=A0ABD2B7P9_VESSQ